MPVHDTQDIALAGYICMRASREPDLGVRMVKVERNGKDSTFIFLDDRNVWDELAVDFERSESAEFDAKVRLLKTIGYSKDRRGANARY